MSGTNRDREAAERPKKQRLQDNAAQLLLDSIVPYQINRLSYRMNRLLDRDLRMHGLSISIWRIMAVLDFNISATVNDLAIYVMIEQSTLSRMLQRMENEGLLRNSRSPDDGRVRSISLTDKGREQYEMVRSVTMKHVGRIVHGFSHAERQQLMAFIDRMQNNVETLQVEGEPVGSKSR